MFVYMLEIALCICVHTYKHLWLVCVLTCVLMCTFLCDLCAFSLESVIGGMQNGHKPYEFSSLMDLDAQKQQSSIKGSISD